MPLKSFVKNTITICLFVVIANPSSSQNLQLKNTQIWPALYSNNSNFDQSKRLIRKVSRDGAELTFKTEIKKIYNYTTGGKRKALVVLFSYDYTNGEKQECHACYPEMEIVTFEFLNNEWVKQKFLQNWKNATGAWGEGPELDFKIYNKVNCLVLKSSYGNQGEFEDVTDYYNAETLKLVKRIKKKA